MPMTSSQEALSLGLDFTVAWGCEGEGKPWSRKCSVDLTDAPFFRDPGYEGCPGHRQLFLLPYAAYYLALWLFTVEREKVTVNFANCQKLC